MKPCLYLETTIPSYLVARRSRDLRLAADQETTEEWWETRRKDFDLFVSEAVLAEVSRGDAGFAAARLAAAHQMDLLLTWNCQHINNPVLERRIERACADCGAACPVICTPAELLKE